jgi:hypothetical protein
MSKRTAAGRLVFMPMELNVNAAGSKGQVGHAQNRERFQP